MFNADFILHSIQELLKELPTTLSLFFISVLVSLFLGMFLTLLKLRSNKFIRTSINFSIIIIRGIPMVVQLYILFNVVPLLVAEYFNSLGTISPFVIALISLSLNYSAYASDIFSTAWKSVDKGQVDACLSVGHRMLIALKRIVFPQALVIAIPNLCNACISLLKDTSLVYMVMVVDLMGRAKIISNQSLNYFEVYIIVAMFYWIMNIAIEILFSLMLKNVKLGGM